MGRLEPQFPLYVVSYDRYENCLTADALQSLQVDFHLVVEPHEQDHYKQAYPSVPVLTVPQEYHDQYDTCDDQDGKSQGPGPARNYARQHSIDQGHEWHWVMDDNIEGWDRFHENKKTRWGDPVFFRIMEDFTLQYENVTMAGPRYRGFVFQRHKYPPVTFNTRVYSCNLIRNDTTYQWRGRYNEDTDLSLRMLKDGYCTIIFNTILQDKLKTQTIGGGNTANFYAHEGTYPKSRMLKELHPDVTRLVRKWGRWHHEVNYHPFKQNQLQKKPPSQRPQTSVTIHETITR